MNVNRAVIITPENETRFQSFIVFEPASSRIAESDTLFQGEQAVEIFESIVDTLNENNNLPSQIILNRLKKVEQMLDLLSNYNSVIITKFFDRIWRRYSSVSNIGESLLDLQTFCTIFPEYGKNKDALLAQRIDQDDEDSDEDADSPRIKKSKKADDSDDDNNDNDDNNDDDDIDEDIVDDDIDEDNEE